MLWRCALNILDGESLRTAPVKTIFTQERFSLWWRQTSYVRLFGPHWLRMLRTFPWGRQERSAFRSRTMLRTRFKKVLSSFFSHLPGSRFYQGYLLILLLLLLFPPSGPQLSAPDISRSQWALPDLNCELQISTRRRKESKRICQCQKHGR